MPLIFNGISCIRSRIGQRLITTVAIYHNYLTTVPNGVIRRSALNFIRPRICPYTAQTSWVNILIPIITKSRRLLLSATGVGAASITLLHLSESSTEALPLQEPPPQQMNQVTVAEANTPQGNVLFVNPSVKDAISGTGSEASPFKTIAQALSVAQPNTVIILSTGTYSTESGETFPLQLKPGVSIQGDARTRGSNIVIQGGGTFLSPTFARQNVAILGADRASITGVTITNSNPRGYGLWIESSSPTVSDNTFTGNTHDGISLTGNSSPNIRSNYFYQNGANGITIYGTSQPEIRENVFEKTGFGINIAQKAAPKLIGNRIIQNRAGIIAQANSRPVLRGNTIEGNKEDGVVAIASSQPDLGTKTEPGGNVFSQNGGYDINSSASSQVIPAFGNTIAVARTSGKIDLTGVTPVVPPATQPQIARNILGTRTNQPQLAQNPQTPVANNNPPKESPAILPLQPARLPEFSGEADATTTPITIPVPPPASIAQLPPQQNSPQQQVTVVDTTPTNPSSNIQVATLPTPSADLVIPVPPPASPTVVPSAPSVTGQGLPVLQSAKIVESELLPVPGKNIPIGDSRNLPKVPVTQIAPSPGSPPLPPTPASAQGLRYRVVVEAESESKQELVRSLIPGAFRTFSNGKVFMQAGAFSDRTRADEVLQMLNTKGLKASIQEL